MVSTTDSHGSILGFLVLTPSVISVLKLVKHVGSTWLVCFKCIKVLMATTEAKMRLPL
jgi:hypothetical protein